MPDDPTVPADPSPRSAELIVEGALDLVRGEQLRARAQRQLDALGAGGELRLDLARCTSLDTDAVGALLTIRRSAQEVGVAVRLSHASAHLTSRLIVAGVADLFAADQVEPSAVSENRGIDQAPLDAAVSSPTPGLVVVEPRSDLDLAAAPAFEFLLDEELEAQPEGLLIDLSRCEFVGSPGLAALAAARDHAATSGVWFALTALSGTLLRALAVAGLDSVFILHDSLEDSMEAFHARS